MVDDRIFTMEQLAGVRIRGSVLLTISIEDWSGVRSPGRARRRRRLGHRQNIVHRTIPDPKVYTLPGGDLVCHPETLEALSRGLADLAIMNFQHPERSAA